MANPLCIRSSVKQNVTVQATAHDVGIAPQRANAIAGRQVVGRSLQPIVERIHFVPMLFVLVAEINCLTSWVIFSVAAGLYIVAAP